MPILGTQTIESRHLAKHNRWKYINLLEKITKNLFKMLRDEACTKQELADKFTVLYKKMSNFTTTHLDSEYHRAMQAYIEQMARIIQTEWELDERVRAEQMTRLNRLQKIKNSTAYKRKKDAII